jgi:hypothetical protein
MKIKEPKPVTAPSFVCSRPATGFESRWQLRSGGTRCEAVSGLTPSSEVRMAGAPARHQAPLLRFLILLTAQSAEGG